MAKTYLKRYETVDVKGVLDQNEDGVWYISYENSAKERVTIDLEQILTLMAGSLIQFKTILE